MTSLSDFILFSVILATPAQADRARTGEQTRNGDDCRQGRDALTIVEANMEYDLNWLAHSIGNVARLVPRGKAASR